MFLREHLVELEQYTAIIGARGVWSRRTRPSIRPPPPPGRWVGTGVIIGLVVEAGSEQPVAGARVSVSLADGGSTGGLTNERGRFLLLNVPYGAYMLRVAATGHLTQRQGVCWWPDRSQRCRQREGC